MPSRGWAAFATLLLFEITALPLQAQAFLDVRSQEPSKFLLGFTGGPGFNFTSRLDGGRGLTGSSGSIRVGLSRPGESSFWNSFNVGIEVLSWARRTDAVAKPIQWQGNAQTFIAATRAEGKWKPYLSLGLGYAVANRDGGVNSSVEHGIGGSFGGGLDFQVGGHMHLTVRGDLVLQGLKGAEDNVFVLTGLGFKWR